MAKFPRRQLLPIPARMQMARNALAVIEARPWIPPAMGSGPRQISPVLASARPEKKPARKTTVIPRAFSDRYSRFSLSCIMDPIVLSRPWLPALILLTCATVARVAAFAIFK